MRAPIPDFASALAGRVAARLSLPLTTNTVNANKARIPAPSSMQEGAGISWCSRSRTRLRRSARAMMSSRGSTRGSGFMRARAYRPVCPTDVCGQPYSSQIRAQVSKLGGDRGEHRSLGRRSAPGARARPAPRRSARLPVVRCRPRRLRPRPPNACLRRRRDPLRAAQVRGRTPGHPGAGRRAEGAPGSPAGPR